MGRTDPSRAGSREVICFHVKSGEQTFGNSHLEQGHDLGMLRSIRLSWGILPLWWSRKGTQRPRTTRVSTPAPQNRRPHS